jgi:hypothetical protein
LQRLARTGELSLDTGWVRLAGHEVAMTKSDEALWLQIGPLIDETPALYRKVFGASRKGNTFAQELGEHLVVNLAVLDLLEEPDRIALDNGAGRKGSRSQHEAVDAVAVTTTGANNETIRKWLCARDFDRAQIS